MESVTSVRAGFNMPVTKPQTLADQLRQAIEHSGVTLYKLSQDSGVDRSQLSRFMRGERDMSLLVTDKVCQVLGLRFCKSAEDDAPRSTQDPRAEGQRPSVKQARQKKRGRRET